MRAAAIQLNSTADRRRNLERAERLVRDAASDGAELVVLPEHFDLRATDSDYREHAEPLDGPTLTRMRELAATLAIELVAGSIAERRDGHDKRSNTSVHVGPDGSIRGVYRKIHLFDVTVDTTDYRESDAIEAGEETVVSHAAGGTGVGLTVCYDLRFPELYGALALDGALVATVPSNFTRPTGTAHWEVLLRARAIESQLYVVAAAQSGPYPYGEAYGNSMIVDPWGEVVARAPGDGECFVAAELDFDRLHEIRAKLPSLAARAPAAMLG